MTTVTVASRIAAPVEHVFEVFTDIDHAAENVSGIRKVEMLSSGGFRLGTRWRETREVMGRQMSEEMEVTAFERNRTYTITNDVHGTRVDAVFSFEPSDGGTRVSVEFMLEPQSFPSRLLSPLGWALTGRVRDALSHDLADLKHAAEKVPIR